MLECVMSVPSFSAFEHLSSSERKKKIRSKQWIFHRPEICLFCSELLISSNALIFGTNIMQSSICHHKNMRIFFIFLMNLQFTPGLISAGEQKRLVRFLYMETVHSCTFGRNFVNNSCRLNQMFTANFETKRAITGLAKWYAYSYDYKFIWWCCAYRLCK